MIQAVDHVHSAAKQFRVADIPLSPSNQHAFQAGSLRPAELLILEVRILHGFRDDGDPLISNAECPWIEFMGGALLSTTEKTTFEVDVRYSERFSWISVFAECEYNAGMRKWFILPSAAVPVRIGPLRFGVGTESDFVFSPGGDLIVVGPRATVPFHSAVTSARARR